MRTAILSDRGLVRELAVHERDPSILARRIVEILASDPPSETLPEMDGLGTTVDRLASLLSTRKVRTSVAGHERVARRRSAAP